MYYFENYRNMQRTTTKTTSKIMYNKKTAAVNKMKTSKTMYCNKNN